MLQVKQLEPSLHCLRLHRCVGQTVEVHTPGPHELILDQVRGSTHMDTHAHMYTYTYRHARTHAHIDTLRMLTKLSPAAVV